jgi:hypothetical protein
MNGGCAGGAVHVHVQVHVQVLGGAALFMFTPILTDAGFLDGVWPMRFLLNVSIPHEDFNAAVRDGSVGQKIKRILDETKPEAVYFTEQHGARGAVLVVDMTDASQIPAFAEPWFLTFRANVEFKVAMTPDELGHAGLEVIGKAWA